ncbi:hypothetical protein PHMEG_0004906 [Phytophthora megakarya]|uniref:PiggyBac transposable element-derived protein domain-containing protein n=1 Tax=Phytophthora megakarya TaxID=4795 RepID=A0A225WSK3_9STRA|nr:hypothetical protein PHMEG_0004906 [Phytophthora megakarya]
MPRKLWTQMATESNRFHSQSIPPRAKVICSQQRRAGANIEDVGVIRKKVLRRIHGVKQPIPAPELVRDYHRSMGGFDCPTTHKYYKTLFLGMFDMALVNAFIVFRLYKNLYDNRINAKKRPAKHYAFFEILVVQLLAVGSTEIYEAIESRYSATTERERTAVSPSREGPSPAPATPATAVIGSHYLEEHPDMKDNTQGLKHRQGLRNLQVQAKKVFQVLLSRVLLRKSTEVLLQCRPRQSEDLLCNPAWDWNNGNDIPSLLLPDHKKRDRPPASHPGKKSRRRTESDHEEKREDSAEDMVDDEAEGSGRTISL